MESVRRMDRRVAADDVLGIIGNTPLVALNHVAAGLGPQIIAKLEFMNPGGSVKDRIAQYLVRDAEQKGLLKPGGIIVEPTSGNTGVALAMLAAVRGYQTIFTMPDKVSEEKRSILRAFGARVVIAPTDLPPDSPDHYVNVARKLASEIQGAYMPNQYANAGNPLAHYSTTGPEVWKQTGGDIDAFVACVGTGGTVSGTGKFLKERKPGVLVVGIEPEGSIYHNKKYGSEFPLHTYLVEGIGEDFVPSTYDQAVVDEIIQVSDTDTFEMALRLPKEEGLLAGGSSGAAVAGALAFARKNPSLRRIVVVLPDTGRSYLSKLYDERWRKSKGLK